MTRMIAMFGLLAAAAAAPVGAVVVIAPGAAAAATPSAPASVDTDPIAAALADPTTLLTIGLGLGIIGLIGRTTRQPRTVAV